MTSLYAAIFIVTGLALVGAEIFTAWPDQRLILAGLVLALVGGLLIADNPSTDRSRHGPDHR